MRYIQETLSKTPSANADLRYTAMVPMDAYHMFTLTNATADAGVSDDQVSAASVTQINVYSNNTVRTFYNDVEYTPLGCVDDQDCTTADFIKAVEGKAGNIELLCKQ